VRQDAARAQVLIEGAPELVSRLVVNAEGMGMHSAATVRQQAIVADVVVDGVAPSTAFERFTRDGPLALLPTPVAARAGDRRDRELHNGQRMALVWCMGSDAAARRSELSDEEFVSELQQAFGVRNGRILEIRPRGRHALVEQARSLLREHRIVHLGNAAQTLHPVAGQGFNLGLRDAWELAQALRSTPLPDPGAAQTLRRYRDARRSDRFATVAATHALVRLFSNDFFALGALRGAGMTLLGCVAPARDVLARRMIFGARA
jgi:2-octaprenyl-6-methoxyphenol hydroxylase